MILFMIAIDVRHGQGLTYSRSSKIQNWMIKAGFSNHEDTRSFVFETEVPLLILPAPYPGKKDHPRAKKEILL